MSRQYSRADYLEVSPYEADGGHQIGKLPASLSTDMLRALGHPDSPIKAIRAKCLECSNGQQSEVRKCVAISCALWPLRMVSNVYHGKAKTGPMAAPASGQPSGEVAEPEFARRESGGQIAGVTEASGDLGPGARGVAPTPETASGASTSSRETLIQPGTPENREAAP